MAVLVEFEEGVEGGWAGAAAKVADEGAAEGGDKAAVTPAEKGKKGKKGQPGVLRWDLTLIGPFCRWRSCLEGTVPSVPGGTVRHVCEVHSELKRYLDARRPTGKEKATSESARYMLRKPLPPVEVTKKGLTLGVMEADVVALLHASTLLQVSEMWVEVTEWKWL